MAGFVGFTNFIYRRENTELVLKNMADAVIMRGKDIEAYYDDRYTHIGYRCNAIENMNQKKNSMTLQRDGNEYIIVWDGELYNKEELLEILKKEKIDIKTNQDEEIILNLFNMLGERFVERIRGVFAFAIWNKTKKELYLARDYLGIKPLFYMQKENNFIFASEVKAILQFPEVDTYITEYGVARMLLRGVISVGNKPFFKDIQKINKGEYAVYDINGIRVKKYEPIKIAEINAPVIQLVEENNNVTFEEIGKIVGINDEPDNLCYDIMLVKECKKIGESFDVQQFDNYEWKASFEERKEIVHPDFKNMIEEFYKFQHARDYKSLDLRSVDRISNRFNYNVLFAKMNGKFEYSNLRMEFIKILENKESPILRYVDRKYISEKILEIDMNTITYLIEANIWLEKYDVKYV